ncbi:HNH endonuclease [Sporomusa sp. KB1]|uniref:HNH endonuclease n=1 Tax=Sporomusa sp. KB1 TaxID=943346 RepID=UPI0011A45465|nr:Restriction endonuclease [Sporomusa sp. KB1]
MTLEQIRQFYRSAVWLHKRTEILKRDNNECQKCKSRGRFSIAECVHHIKHLKNRQDLALEDSNLISLCNSCHNEEHPEKLHSKQIKKKFVNNERW